VNRIRLTAAFVTAAARGRLVAGGGETAFENVSIDTRTIAAGDLFVAIRGERFDGADFAAEALELGAAGIVVPRGWAQQAGAARAAAGPGTGDAAVVEVDDTTVALQLLANAIRKESGAKVVAITGSAGKTTTKEVTSELLATRYRVIRNRGNFNNHIGLPLSLIELRERPEIAVVELGMNHAGEISTLVRVAEPDLRVWTNVGEAHLGFFASVDAIADAKAEVMEGATASTVLVANADDERIAIRAERFTGRVVRFGIDRPAEIRASNLRDRGTEGMAATIATPRGQFELTTPLIGRGNLQNLLAATAVAIEYDVSLEAVAGRARTLAPAAHRGEVVRLSNGVTVIDDSYNANPTATKRALEVLAQSASERKVAVLGEMLELGDRAVALHEEVGRAAARCGVDELVTVGGPAAAAMADAAIAAGLKKPNVRYIATSDEAAEAVAATVRRGDVVLVKGSRGVKTDRVVERLKAVRN
jgi:UDP-N-acetylmuramoyl-tripeptide--D-alanyl-D-alanine ligase